MQKLIYLDYNATAPMLPSVKEAMMGMAGSALNPSSIHAMGRAARKVVEDARASILRSVNAENLIFCGSASEANNQVARFKLQDSSYFVSAIEHDSVFKSVENPTIVPVKPDGIIDLVMLEQSLQLETCNFKLISVMLANNETGIIQPIKEVVKIARKFGALVHTDAVQAYGRIPVDFADLGVDIMTIAPHKAGGAQGAAALVIKPGTDLKPFIKGGGQEKNRRAGTENVLAIHAFGVFAGYSENVSRETQLTAVNKYLEDEIVKLGNGFVVVGAGVERLPNTTCLIHPNVEAATQLIHFDMNGICVSSGSACSSGKVEVSRTLQAMGVESAKNAIRISTGWATTKDEIDKFIAQYKILT